MNMTFSSVVILISSVLLLSGCAAYQYQIVEPVAAAGPVEREEVDLQWEPLEYHFVEHHGKLGMRISNPTDDPVTLLGERSYIVDPTGETQPMQGGTIAPHSRITMALPPEPSYARSGPRTGIGIGVGTGYRGAGFGTGFYGTRWSDHPRHYYVHEGGPYWRWVTGPVRMRLVYEQLGERFEHEFAFDRIRVR